MIPIRFNIGVVMTVLVCGWGIFTLSGCTSGPASNGTFWPSGQGAKTLSDGSRYEGNFEHYRRNGYGVQTWPDGARYEGRWLNDKESGRGVKNGLTVTAMMAREAA